MAQPGVTPPQTHPHTPSGMINKRAHGTNPSRARLTEHVQEGVMDTSIMRSSSRSKRITWGGGLSVSLGLIGLPLVFAGVWPSFDHSPWDVNTMVLGAGVFLCTVSYIFGRIAIAAVTEENRNPVSPPTKRPFIVAGVSLGIAILCLVIAVMS